MPAFGYKNVPIMAEAYVETFDLTANAKGYVGAKLMPVALVDKQAAEYYRFDPAHLLDKRIDDRVSAEGNFNEVNLGWTYASYSTEDRGVEFRLTDREKGIHGNDIALEVFGARKLNNMLALNHEVDVLTLVNAETATPTGTLDAWLDPDHDIVADVEAMQTRLRNKDIPINPMYLKLCVSWQRWRAMRKNRSILDTFGSQEKTDVGQATRARIADILEVGEVVVAEARQNTKAPNAANTATISDIWTTNKVALVCTGPTGQGEEAGMGEVCWGRTLIWDGAGAPPRFDRYIKENKTAEVMRQRGDRALHRVCATAIEVIVDTAS